MGEGGERTISTSTCLKAVGVEGDWWMSSGIWTRVSGGGGREPA